MRLDVRVVEFSADLGTHIELFQSVGSSAVPLGHGNGETHVYAIHFEEGGKIGAHPAGFAQLFLVVQGRGWAAGADGQQVELRAGQGAYFERGEVHSKGAHDAMLAIMVQASVMPPL
jgi:quercetin dioxygenase-like cupin family protein